jgi:hypothetical protein
MVPAAAIAICWTALKTLLLLKKEIEKYEEHLVLAWCILRFTRIRLTCVIVNSSTSRSVCDFYMSPENGSLILVAQSDAFCGTPCCLLVIVFFNI